MSKVYLLLLCQLVFTRFALAQANGIVYQDNSRLGKSMVNDPFILRFKGLYWLYYSLPATENLKPAIGIAVSEDFTKWSKLGEVLPDTDVESKGIFAPSVLILENKVHLFYTAVNAAQDSSICHAVSDDGIHFEKDRHNPMYKNELGILGVHSPEVIPHEDQFLLFHTNAGKISLARSLFGELFEFGSFQISQESSFNLEQTFSQGNPSVIELGGEYFLFYEENASLKYAKSKDGLRYKAGRQNLLLSSNSIGELYRSPAIFQDLDGFLWLFYAYSPDGNISWQIGAKPLIFNKNLLSISK